MSLFGKDATSFSHLDLGIHCHSSLQILSSSVRLDGKVPAPVASAQIESPEPAFTPDIPAEYMAFQDVFSKQAATHLPPHWPWDCAIDLLPGAQLPKGRVYPLSIPERQVMKDYIAKALNQGFIRPSTSPAASSFFVGKKDGGLRPCNDYRQLNSQIIQQPYPLPLVPAALEELCGAQVFTKLDLRSAYNLVRIREGDEWKTAFVTPTGHYEYQVMPYGLSISPSVFQTFMNEVFWEFLHRFVVVYTDDILIYSRNLAEHRQHVQQVLLKLRQHHLTPVHEVDASTTGVGAVLSQAVGEPAILHPCAFYSWKLSPVEQTYDVGNRELLAIKLALEEWRHWLEGAIHPFTIITDHKNLQYLRDAKRFNPRQARWALFFTRFSFKIIYQPGSKNIPADALSRQSSSDQPTDPEPILPPNLIVSPIIWNLDQDIQQATLQEPAPSLLIFPLDITHRLMARQREKSRSSDVTSGHTVVKTNTAEAGSSRGLMRTRLQASTVPLDGGTLKCSSCRPLVSREWDSAHHHLQQAVRRDKHFADARCRSSPHYQPGDLVWLSTPDLRLRLPCRKLSPRYIGPFKILRQINNVTFQLQFPPRYRIHPTFHVSLLKPFYPSATETPGAEAEPPPPEVLDQPSIYTIHQILYSRRRGGHLEYLIDWEGYGPEERSWVPRDDVLDPTLLADFHRNHPDRPAPHRRGRPRRRLRASGAAPGGGG
ncbi:Transposon Tf2-11 polyprotein [Labeo rohita]|uniref:ribonuclease H n=1 Tax=Labeo rohita TaxID=84645 RepID=A0ABQ8M4Y2_LABRO|nr:Transposon Tf2-11 polyprotein [Labeo rohita]